MKMKEVIELCQADIRYSALKTGGEKKQALAEYQVRLDMDSLVYLCYIERKNMFCHQALSLNCTEAGHYSSRKRQTDRQTDRLRRKYISLRKRQTEFVANTLVQKERHTQTDGQNSSQIFSCNSWPHSTSTIS